VIGAELDKLGVAGCTTYRMLPSGVRGRRNVLKGYAFEGVSTRTANPLRIGVVAENCLFEKFLDPFECFLLRLIRHPSKSLCHYGTCTYSKLAAFLIPRQNRFETVLRSSYPFG